MTPLFFFFFQGSTKVAFNRTPSPNEVSISPVSIGSVTFTQATKPDALTVGNPTLSGLTLTQNPAPDEVALN